VCGQKRYKSIYRRFLLFGQVERTMTAGRPHHAHMEVTQAMKCLQQFAADGHWGIAWKLVTIPDPFRSRVVGATEPELEAALAEIRVEEDLRRRSKANMQAPQLSDDEDQETQPPTTHPKKKKGERAGAAKP
jgi:hypothetical protein